MMPLMQKTRRRRTAFTLVELLVVITIITVMMSLLMAGVQRARDAGKRTEAHSEIRELGAGHRSLQEQVQRRLHPVADRAS